MKSKIILFALLLFSESLMAQFTVAQPEVFRLATIPSIGCSMANIGKIYYSTISNTASFCQVASQGAASSPWEGTSDIYYMGKVGIMNQSPIYDHEINADTRINTLLVNGNVGINTLVPTERLEIVNRDIFIKSTGDAKSWRFLNNDANNKFELREDGAFRMQVNYGGNIAIGTGTVPTHKLLVEGDVNYEGSLSVEGKGTLANTNADQLKMATYASGLSGGQVIPANGCITMGLAFVNGTFSAPPNVIMGQKLTGSTSDEHLVFSISNVTANLATLNICNNSASSVGLANHSYSYVAIGK